MLRFAPEELDLPAGFSFLVPKGAGKEDIEVIVTENGQDMQVRFTLKPEFAIPAYAELGVLELTVLPDEPDGGLVDAAAEVTGGSLQDEGGQGAAPVTGALVLLWAARVFAAILGLCVLLFIVLLTMRWINIRKYRRRRLKSGRADRSL